MTVVSEVAIDLKTARDRVWSLINEESGDVFTDAEINNELNAAASRIHRMIPHNPIEATTSMAIGQSEYVIPDAALLGTDAHIIAVYSYADGTNTALSQTYWTPLDTDAETGEPETFAVNGKSIQLTPIPDAMYTLRVIYYREYVRVSGDTDVFDIPDTLVDACIYYAAYMMKMLDEEYTSADRFKAMYDEALYHGLLIPTGVYSA